MGDVIVGTSVSVDGFIADHGGGVGPCWTAMDVVPVSEPRLE